MGRGRWEVGGGNVGHERWGVGSGWWVGRDLGKDEEATRRWGGVVSGGGGGAGRTRRAKVAGWFREGRAREAGLRLTKVCKEEAGTRGG